MTLRYPSDGFSGDADFVTFRHMKYKSRPSGGSGGSVGGGNIILYMPESLPQVTNQNQWGQFSPGSGLIGKAKLDAVGGLNNTIMDTDLTKPMSEEQRQNAVDKMKGYFENLGANSQSLGKEAALKGVANLMGYSPNQVMSVTQGSIYNPNIELAYEGPVFRTFGFSFNFIPKSAQDSQAINNIIREFKKNSAPKVMGGSGMYEIPHVWQVSYQGPASGFMNKFKPAACVSVSVQDNAGIAYYASHKDGAPVQTTLSLGFMEVDVITSEDHTSGRGM
jgi:hypothetical protein